MMVDGDGDGQFGDRRTAFAVDADGIILDCDESCWGLLGWARSDLVGAPLSRIIPARYHDAHHSGFAEYLATGEMPLEGQRPRLQVRHAELGEIDVALILSRAPEGSSAVAIGVLEPVRRALDESTQADIDAVIERSLSEDVPLEDLLARSLGLAAGKHGWIVASVWWIDPWVDRLRRVASWEAAPGHTPKYLATISDDAIAKGQGVIGRAWSLGLPSFHENIADEPGSQRDERYEGLRAALVVPLIDGDAVVGVVEMLDDRTRVFSAQDDEAIWLLAAALGRLLADRLRREHELVQRERVRIALTAGEMGVWSYHIETGIVTWDEQLERLLGFEVGEFGNTIDAFFDLVHPDDRDAVRQRFSNSVANSAGFNDEFRALRVDGRSIWLQTAAAPMADSEGTPRALSGVAFDVTERVETARKIQARNKGIALAADVGRALVSREPLAVRLHATAEAVVAQVDAAFARIWVLPPGGNVLELQASAGLYTHLDGGHARIRVGEYKIGRIAAEVTPHLSNDVVNDPMVSDPEWARDQGMVAFAGYPLVVGEVLVGVLGLFARRKLPDDTVSALAAIADSVAIAILQDWTWREMEDLIEDAQRHAAAMESAMRDRAHVAQILQSSLLPPSLPRIHEIELGAAYRAGVEEVGGDFYDVTPVGSGWGFMIGDVCGRGPEAARLTALARHSLRTALLLGNGPSESLRALNESLLAAENDLRFCTVVCGTLEVNAARDDEEPTASRLTVHLAVGGHPLPRVLRLDGTVEHAGVPGSLLGILDDPRHHNSTTALAPGEIMVLFTDGVTEAWSDDEMFGSGRLDKVIAAQLGRHPRDIADAIVAAVSSFAPAANDDLAILVIGAPRAAIAESSFQS